MTGFRNRHLLVLDAALLFAAPFFLYALRFEGLRWPDGHFQTALVFALCSVPIRLFVFRWFGLYSRLWRYASTAELELIFVAGVVGSVFAGALGGLVLPLADLTPIRVPLSILFTNSLLALATIAAPRILIRIGGWRPASRRVRTDGRRVLIVGAGTAGKMVMRELRHREDLQMVPVGFVDDDPTKHGLMLAGLPVLGAVQDLPTIVQNQIVHEVVIAMPTASGKVVRRIVRAALDAGVTARTIPALTDIISGKVTVGSLRAVEIQDLLRREPIKTNMSQVRPLAAERTVLVTGAGGSIGSELARQIAQLGPARLLLLGHGENPIFHIHNELRAAHPELELYPIIADIRDRRRMFQIFELYRPDAVFHAAAHKHVPLMEQNVYEAVTNNVKGTQNIVDAALEVGTRRFVLISSDKAVRPTSVMGATKRIAEQVVRHAAMTNGTDYVAVRFGNVLGSEGSVVPTFVKQIKRGGPITITHPDMQRYFMTIPEAVQLVLQAAALGDGGELFMLDMGEPVKIVDLATDLVRLSGQEVGRDIDIEFTGVRPGEKLYEEMTLDHEETTPTAHPKVLCVRDPVTSVSRHLVDNLVDASIRGADDEELRRLIRFIVPDYAESQRPPISIVSASPDKRASGAHTVAGEPGSARRSGAHAQIAESAARRRTSREIDVIAS